MATRQRPAAVIFDLDGTLADTFDHMVAAFGDALEPLLGRRPTRGEVIATFGPGAGTEPAILGDFLGRTDAAATERYYAAYEGGHGRVALFPGVGAALEALAAAGVPLGVMTGKSRRSALITLRALGVVDRFSAIITGDEATRAKPDPMGPLLAAQALGVNPARCVYVGDSRADIGAGRAAGMTTALVGWNQPSDAAEVRDLFHPDIFCRTGDEFVAWARSVVG